VRYFLRSDPSLYWSSPVYGLSELSRAATVSSSREV
jgi:hypothetical protein